jgi:hypothetical protein
MKVDIWAKLMVQEVSPLDVNPEDRAIRLSVTDRQSDTALIDYSGPKICTRELLDHLVEIPVGSGDEERLREFRKNLLERNEARVGDIEVDETFISKLADQCS